jgi:hypothetical protein
MLADNTPNTPAKMMRQRGGMRRCNHLATNMPAEEISWKYDRTKCRFCGPRRHLYHKPITSAVSYILQAIQQQPMMSCQDLSFFG